jgi:hypothetical protein
VELSKGCIQTRLLADVASIRNRHKKETIGALLQTEKLKQHVVVVKYAELTLLESIEVYNPSAEAQTFKIEVCLHLQFSFSWSTSGCRANFIDLDNL